MVYIKFHYLKRFGKKIHREQLPKTKLLILHKNQDVVILNKHCCKEKCIVKCFSKIMCPKIIKNI